MNEKLDVGTVLQRVFDTYRSQLTLLLSAAVVVFLPIAVLTGLILSSGAFALIIVVGIITVVASFWYQGMVVEAARDMLDGRRDHTLGSLFASVAPVVGPLLVAGLLAGIAIGIGTALLIIPGLFLRTIWAVLAPVIVLERPGILAAFGRSWELIRGHAWQVFGVIVVVFLLDFVSSFISRAIGSGADSVVVYIAVELVRTVLIAPVAGLAAAIIFFELKRLRGEPVSGTAAPGIQPAATAGGPGSPPPPPAGTPGAPPPPPEGQQPGAPPPPPGA